MRSISKTLIHEEVFTWLKQARLQKRLHTIIEKIHHFVDQHERLDSNRIRKLSSGTRCYKIRLSSNLRLIFSITGMEDEVTLNLISIVDHRQGEKAHQQVADFQKIESELEIEMAAWVQQPMIEPEPIPEKKQASARHYLWHDDDAARLEKNPRAELWWQLDPEQLKFTSQPGPLILKGSAGSGKTTIALYRLMTWKSNQPNARALYITYSSRLKSFAEKNYQALSHIEELPLFYTVDEICRAQLSPDQKRCFDQESHVGFPRFEAFLKRQNNPYLPSMLWEEFRGILKGSFYLAHHPEISQGLTLEQYSHLDQVGMAKDDSLFEKDKKQGVYRLFELYQRWLKDNNLWDDLDLARTALNNIKQAAEKTGYTQLLVDEVQDLTPFHLQIMLSLSSDPFGLFLTGDADQSIHPSRFQWTRLKDQIYNHASPPHSRSGKMRFTPRLEELKINYRSSLPIVEFNNALSAWRKKQWKDEALSLGAINVSGAPVGWLDASVLTKLEQCERLPVSLMILVPTEELKQQLIHDQNGPMRRNSNLVFTIHESKGLEAVSVLVWGFFSYYRQGWPFTPAHNPEKFRHQARYQVNLLNVACTRARDELIIIDDYRPEWDPLHVISPINAPATVKLLDQVVSRISTNEEWSAQAIILENNGNWLQAAETWRKMGVIKRYHRCQALYHKLHEEWLPAGENFQDADDFLEAASCFERAGDYLRALVSLLQSEKNETMARRLDDFLGNPDKMAKLKGDASAELLKAIVSSESRVPISSLFKYSRARYRLYREMIRSVQREGRHVLYESREAIQRNQGLQAAFEHLNIVQQP